MKDQPGSETSTTDQRSEIQDRLIKDLKEGKFVLYYQAIAHVAPSVVELPPYRQVLVRFKDEEDGLMPPGTFIPILEQYGLMPVLDRWVMQEVPRWIAKEQAAVAPKPAARLSVTLSVDTLRRDPAFVDYAVRRVVKGGVRPGSLSFDIALWEAIPHARTLAPLIEPLRAAGCSFGLSGFNGEQQDFELAESLGITYVKIDGSLIYAVVRDPEARKKIAAIQERCHGLGMLTICAQVEDSATLEVLREINVDYAQGFGIERPRILS